MYKFLIRPFFFLFSAEKAHYTALGVYRFILRIPGIKPFLSLINKSGASESVELFGLQFPNRVGVAAGFDKEAVNIEALQTMGFGFVEIGTVTPQSQSGNPKPRLFRLKKDEAIINRMGFNSQGMDVAKQNLIEARKRGLKIIVGGNIGKNKVTPNENASDDYLKCLHALHPHVDYFTINVSSPNTPNLRELQEKEPLKRLIAAIQAENSKMTPIRPVLLKIAPDLTDPQLDDIVDIMQETKLDGLVATNTTIDRSDLATPESTLGEIGAGGLSGKPVRVRATEVIKYIKDKSNGSFPIIGVGGIHSAKDAQEKIDAGASLVQVYTGFIYEGPALVKRIRKLWK